jgi:hypothetical protein
MPPSDDPDDWPRITDLSGISEENIKYRNTEFLNADGHPYEVGWDYSRQELRRKAWNARNGDLRKLMRRFPTDVPLRRQCAHWVHGLIGVHLFPDANHRTAVATLRQLLSQNNISYEEWDQDALSETREESHDVRQQVNVTMACPYQRDALHDLWYEFFEAQLYVTDS